MFGHVRELVLLAAGHADLQVLAALARCEDIDATACSVRLSEDHAPLTYDVLSIDTGAVLDRGKLEASMQGASEHAVLLRPLERFAQRWPGLVEQARQRALSIVVIGAGAAGTELACVRRQHLWGSHLTLLTGGGELAHGYPARLQAQVSTVLHRRHITVLHQACTGISANEIVLSGGATLACDVPIVAIDQPMQVHQPPRRTLNLLSCGTTYAIASWGNLSFGGGWVWRWKDPIDRRFVQKYRA